MEAWKVWDNEQTYGDLFFKRATGELPEMESSKALAKIIQPYLEEGDKIGDIGCGGGHYLRSIDSKSTKPFHYVGVDQTAYYIQKAREAFSRKEAKNELRLTTSFIQGDIFSIPLNDEEVDVVICNNVLLHLPSVEKPISELIRIAKKTVIIRALFGDHTLRIKQIHKPEEFDENGEPIHFHFHNIYSKAYVESILVKNGIEKFHFFEDKDFLSEAFNTSQNYVGERPDNLTIVLNGMQVNTYIIQPWTFLVLEK
jgi:ubiquinone/menaquinone biosynthesis C-methylase UbiE